MSQNRVFTIQSFLPTILCADKNRTKGSKFKVHFCDKVGVPLQMNPLYCAPLLRVASPVACLEHRGCQIQSAKNTRKSRRFHLHHVVFLHALTIPTHNPDMTRHRLSGTRKQIGVQTFDS